MNKANSSKLNIPERDYITKLYEHISEYASKNGVTEKYVMLMIRNDLIVSAIYCEGEIYIESDESLPEYVSARKFASLNNADYRKVIDDVKQGNYQTAIIEENGRIYIENTEKCLSSSMKVNRIKVEKGTKYDIPEGYVRFDEFAPEKGLNPISIAARAKRGGIKTAMKVRSKWCAKRSELEFIYRRFAIPPNDDYITAEEYSKMYDQSYQTVVNYAKVGHYKTAIRYGKCWYIDKKESPYYERFISVIDYAKIHDMTEENVLSLIEEGRLEYRKHVMHGKLYIHKNEKLYEL